ncbi:hypothetical protein [Pandoraea anhela]|uniref:Uncharacterized protein n=1 Tax=Pandoraea anhela TaxID=2508295 RepID=A0A5E4SGJ7_9BURK|nr:hypothetical protein [Pandoraea anhela]VVD73614.1 hypothetical protein PAN31108_00730 [Pandoraea anhela]
MPHMPHHHRAFVATPRYTLSHTADTHRHAHEFPHRFRGSRATQRANSVSARSTPRRSQHARHVADHAPQRTTVWPAILALAVVSNLVAPTLASPAARSASSSPSARFRRPDTPDVTTQRSVGDDVRIVPVRRIAIKTDYPLPDLMRAIGSAGAPFRHLGQSIDDLHFAVSAEAIDKDTLATMQRVGDFVDLVTGLVPSVQRLRIPGYAADLAADAAQGQVPAAERIASLIQMSDPRSLGLPDSMHAGVAPRDTATGKAFPPAPAWDHGLVEAPPAPADAVALSEPDGSHAGHADPADAPDTPADGGVADAVPDTAHDTRAAPPATSARPRYIEGEREFLAGYAQHLPPASRPPESHSRLILVDGHHYLRGEAGDYRVTRATGAPAMSGVEHWLVDAPRGSRAQVPVTYDPRTGTWRAERALRLCGGGCGPSRESTPDSVGMSLNQVADAIRHIKHPQIRKAILLAYDDLSRMHLMRTNREDLRAMRDNSIVEHRRVLVPQLMRLDPHATLFEQQREAATITTIHYDNYAETGFYTLSPEAFCQENAEILFHYLLTRGVPSHHIRMITVRPQGHPPHVMVLYTESDQFIDLLELNTPQPPVVGHVDGINGEKFTAAVFLTRDSTVLLDPWSRVKASSFRSADDIEELMGMLDVALADAGHRQGNPFVVSVTRPYPAPRERVHLVRQSIASLRKAAKTQAMAAQAGSAESGHVAAESSASAESADSAESTDRRDDAPSSSSDDTIGPSV